MVHIPKPPAPAILLTDGTGKAFEHCNHYDSSTPQQRRAKKFFPFEGKIYSSLTVRAILSIVQHGKCAFCETPLLGCYGDVEHFRPKAAWQQQKGDTPHYPGYYWLAYDWDNLFLSCEYCNRSFKKNLFPLADPAKRAFSHHDSIQDEEPLLIHPTFDNPEDFLGFRGRMPYAINGNAKGKATISMLGLGNSEPKIRKFQNVHLQTIKTLLEARDTYSDNPTPKNLSKLQRINRLLHEYQTVGMYASMTQAFIRDYTSNS
jgi:uncharacterized protein (TIGR02646 family)